MRSILLPGLLAGTTLHAQWSTPDVNTRVSGAGDVGAATPLSAPGPEGSTYITWFEAASNYRLMMQRLDADGQAMWQEGGIVVSDEPQNTALFRFDMKSDHAGNTIVAFQDQRSGALDVVAYRVAPDGSMLWGDGLALPTPGTTGIAPTIGVLNDDRVVIAWNTNRSPATVAYRILPATGMPAEEAPLEIGGTGIHGRPKVVPNADGGFWLQYVQQPGNFLSPGTMKATRFAADGTALHDDTISTATISGFYFPEPISDGENGLYIAFNSGNIANQNMTDVYVQRLRADGSRWSDRGSPVEDGATTNRYANNTAPALIGNAEGLMIAYSRKNGAQSEGGVHVQRFATAGTALLGATGAEVVPSSSALPEPFGTIAAPDGAVFGCTMGSFSNETAAAFHVGLDGTLAEPQIPLATTPSGIDDASLVPFHNGQAVTVWQDDRYGGSILAQPIMIDISTGIADATNGTWVRLVQGSVHELLFTEGTPAELLITVYAADGKRLHEQRLPAQAPGARVQLDLDRHAASGASIVHVHSADRSTMFKAIVP
jgi:hypothetical protein